MSFLKRLKFQSKINLGITSVVIFFGLISAVLVSRVAVNSLLAENKDQGVSLARNLANRAVDPLLASDFLRLKNLVQEITELSDHNAYAFILDKRDRVMVHTFSSGFPVELRDANQSAPGKGVSIRLLDTGELIYDFASPVVVAGDQVGTVRIGISRARVQSTVDRVLTTIIVITAGVAFVSVLLGSIFARNVSGRINALRDSAHEVVKGNLEVSTAPALDRDCWEIMDCDKEDCPAYGDRRLRCWFHVGTMCPGCEGKELHQKFHSCAECKVYKLSAGDEITRLAETFDFMAMRLNDHIGELRSTQDDLMRQQRLMKTILDVTPDLVSLQDENLRYKAVNKAFLKFFHLDEEDVLGRTDFDIFSEEQADRTYHEDKQILLTGKHLSKQVLIGSDNNKRWFHVLKVPVYDENGVMIGLLLTARDISVIKQYQEQLIQSQKMQDLGKLAGGVAHEINTPLGIILGYVQLLLEDVPEGEQTHADLAIVEKQTKVCRKIVSDLLNFSRNTESAMDSMDLNASIEEVVSVVEHIFRQERVFVEKDLDPTIPPIIGDKEKLKQVWINLLNNAFDAIGQDGRILVATKLCSHRKRVVVSISDNGKGIRQEDLNRIFDPFFTTKPVGEGTGLGLSVTFGIISDHNGRISAISPAPVEYLPSKGDTKQSGPPGPGTVFFIELPLTKEGLPDEECPEIAAVKESGQAVLQEA